MKRGLPAMGAVVGASIAACVSIPQFQQRDAGGTDGATVDGDNALAPEVGFVSDGNGGGTVVAPNVFVHFGSGVVHHFPDLINIGGVPTIGRNSAVACNAEDEVGVALYPAGRVAVNGAAEVTSTNLISHLLGPAVVKLEVFSITTMHGMDAASNAVDRDAVIRSRFTFHPDGKMFRYDTVELGSGSNVTTASINCDAGSTGFVPTSFTTLVNDPNATLYRGSNNVMLTIPTSPATSLQDTTQTSACIDYAGARQVAIAWYDSVTRIRAPTPTTLAFVYDFDRAAGGSNEMGSGTYWTRSLTIFGRGNSCTASGGVHDHAKRWRATHNLIVNQVPFEIANDGIYGGETDPGNQIGIDMPTGGLTITGDVPSPFALWIIYTPGTNALDIQKADTLPPFYQVQSVGSEGKEWVIWFRDPIAPGQTITVKPT